MATSEERATGRLEADVFNMKEQLVYLHTGMEELKGDVSDIKVLVAEMRTELRILTKRQSPNEVIYAFLMFAAAGAGIWFKDLDPWIAGGLVLAGAILLQRGELSKIVGDILPSRRREKEKADES